MAWLSAAAASVMVGPRVLWGWARGPVATRQAKYAGRVLTRASSPTRTRCRCRADTPAAPIGRVSDAGVACVGLGVHGFVARVFGDETALRLIRFGSVPVLAVPPAFTRAPRTIVVAVDMKKAHPLYRRVISRSKKFYVHDEENRA